MDGMDEMGENMDQDQELQVRYFGFFLGSSTIQCKLCNKTLFFI